MARFEKGDKVMFRNPATYLGNKKYNDSTERNSSSGKAIRTTPTGVYVEKDSGGKEFVHRNRIIN